MSKKILYIDMDEVLVDFYGHPDYPIPKDSYNHPNMYKKGFFFKLPPLPGAIEAVNQLIECDKYDVYIATKPVYDLPLSYSDKVKWIAKYIPRLSSKIIMLQRKGLLSGDYLIDDTEAYGLEFNGELIHFKRSIDSKTMWKRILTKLLGDM